MTRLAGRQVESTSPGILARALADIRGSGGDDLSPESPPADIIPPGLSKILRERQSRAALASPVGQSLPGLAAIAARINGAVRQPPDASGGNQQEGQQLPTEGQQRPPDGQGTEERVRRAERLSVIRQAALARGPLAPGETLSIPGPNEQARKLQSSRIERMALDGGADQEYASKVRQAASLGQTVHFLGGLPITNDDLLDLAGQNGVTPQTLLRAGSDVGQLHARFARTLPGQAATALEGGLFSFGNSLLSLAGRAVGNDSVVKKAQENRRLDQEYQQYIARGGDLSSVIGERFSSIAQAAVTSLSEQIPTALLAGPAGIYAFHMGTEWDRALYEAENDLGLSAGKAQAYSLSRAIVLGALMKVTGGLAKRFGFETAEETFGRGFDAARRTVESKLGLRELAVQVAGAGEFEALEEGSQTTITQALNKLLAGKPFDVGEIQDVLLTSLLAGGGARGATGSQQIDLELSRRQLSEGSKQLRNTAGKFVPSKVQRTIVDAVDTIRHALGSGGKSISDTFEGAFSAESAFREDGGDVLANAIGARADTLVDNPVEFAEVTGIENTTQDFRDGYITTAGAYGAFQETTAGPRAVISSIEKSGLPLKEGQGFRAKFTTQTGEQLNEILFTEAPDSLKINITSGLPSERRGHGFGLAESESMVRLASDRGKTALESDNNVSRSAAAVYGRLEDRGYHVTRNPTTVEIPDLPGEQGGLATEDGGPVFTVDATKIPSAPGTITDDTTNVLGEVHESVAVSGGLENISDQYVNDISSRRNLPDGFLTGEDGTAVIPEDILGGAVTEAKGTISRIASGLRAFHLNWLEALQRQANKSPDHLRPQAKAVAAEIRDVFHKHEDTLGRMQKVFGVPFDKALSQAGSWRSSRASIEAQRPTTELRGPNGAIGKNTVLQDSLQPPAGSSAPVISERLQKIVDSIHDIQDKTGRFTEHSRKARRSVLEKNTESRVRFLQAMTDDRLRREYELTFPGRVARDLTTRQAAQKRRRQKEIDAGKKPRKLKDVKPLHERLKRNELIDGLAQVELFKNPGPNIFLRFSLEPLRQFYNPQVTHPAQQEYIDWMAWRHNVPSEKFEADLRRTMESYDDRTSVEFQRQYEHSPAIFVDSTGTEHALLESNPYHYISRLRNNLNRLATLFVLGDKWTSTETETVPTLKGPRVRPVPPIDALAKRARRAGLDTDTTAAVLNGMNGQDVSRNVSVEQGLRTDPDGNLSKSIWGLMLATRLQVSGITQAFENLGNTFLFGGASDTAKAFLDLFRRDPRYAQQEMLQAGAYARDIGNSTMSLPKPASSSLDALSNAMVSVFGTRLQWNLTARLAGMMGARYANKLQSGRGGRLQRATDRRVLTKWLDFSQEETDSLLSGSAHPRKYREVAQRFSSRGIIGAITNPVTEPTIRGNKIYRTLFPFTRFANSKTRDLRIMLMNLYESGKEAGGGRFQNPVSNEKLGADLLMAGRFLGGLSAAGLWANLIRSVLVYGFDEGLGMEKDRLFKQPISTVLSNLASGSLGFIAQSIYWAATRLDRTAPDVDIVSLTGAASGGVATELFSLLASMGLYESGKLGLGRYQKLDGPLDMVAAYLSATNPALRAMNTLASEGIMNVPAARVVIPFALGSRDLKMDAARRSMFQFMDDNHMPIGSGNQGDVSGQLAEFYRKMQAFSMEVRSNNSLTPERIERQRALLMEAIGTKTKDPQQLAASIKGKASLNFLNDKAMLREFAQKHPEHYSRLLMEKQLLEAWAKAVKP